MIVFRITRPRNGLGALTVWFDPAVEDSTATAQAEGDKANADVDYVYDTSDRVISRVETRGTVTSTTLYFYAGTSGALIEETDQHGKTKARYLLDGEGESLAQTYKTNTDGTSTLGGEKWSWLLHDAVGNTPRSDRVTRCPSFRRRLPPQCTPGRQHRIGRDELIERCVQQPRQRRKDATTARTAPRPHRARSRRRSRAALVATHLPAPPRHRS